MKKVVVFSSLTKANTEVLLSLLFPKELENKGIYNIAQYIAYRYFSRKDIIPGNKKLLENIKHAKINLTDVKD